MCSYRKEKGKKKVLVVQRQLDTICAPEWGLQGSAGRWLNSPLKVRRRHNVSSTKLVWVWGEIDWTKAELDANSLRKPHPFSQ